MQLNIIHNTDCLELMKSLPDKCIDLIATDPPYGIGFVSSFRNGNSKLKFAFVWLFSAVRHISINGSMKYRPEQLNIFSFSAKGFVFFIISASRNLHIHCISLYNN